MNLRLCANYLMYIHKYMLIFHPSFFEVWNEDLSCVLTLWNFYKLASKP